MSKSRDGRSCETEFDGRNLYYWSNGNRHKEGRSITRRLNYGTGEAKYIVQKSHNLERAREKVAIQLFSGGLVRISEEVSVMEMERRD